MIAFGPAFFSGVRSDAFAALLAGSVFLGLCWAALRFYRWIERDQEDYLINFLCQTLNAKVAEQCAPR